MDQRQRSDADDGVPSIELEDIREKSGGTRPVGDVTNHPMSGGGDEETEDGLNETDEAIRHAAEDIPDEPDPYVAEADEDLDAVAEDEELDNEPSADEEDIPVFDRGGRD